MKRKKTQLSLACLTGLGLGLLAACGGDVENTGLDDDTARDEFYYPSQSTAKYDLWEEVADYIGVSKLELDTDDKTTIAQTLSQVPKILDTTTNTDFADKRTELDTNVLSVMKDNALKTQCASIVGITAGSTAVDKDGEEVTGTKYHTIKYRLKDAEGNAEEIDRVGLLVSPAQEGPLVMYAHGDAKGLAYAEIAGMFDGLQANHFIAAPSFPGEPLLSGTGSDAEALNTPETTQNGQSMFNEDVREFIGLHNCIFANLSGDIPELDASTLEPKDTNLSANPFSTKIKTANAKNLVDQINTQLGPLYASFPYSYAIGVDRGGLVAQLATARSGYYLQNASDLDSNFPSYLMLPSALVTLGTQYTFMMGTNLLAFQQMLTGTVADSAFGQIPGYSQLGSLFNEDGSSDPAFSTAADVATQLAIRDMGYMSAFIPAALRDWTQTSASALATTAKGTILNFHGTNDAVASFSQSTISYNFRNTVLQNDAIGTSAPGYNHALYAIQAPDSFFTDCTTNDAGKCFNDEDYNHVSDTSFLGGAVVGLSQSQLAGIGGVSTDSTIEATYVDPFASTVETSLSLENTNVAKSLLRTYAYPLTKKPSDLSDDTAPSDDYADEDNRVSVTPPQIIATWAVHQAAYAVSQGL
jgi:hypothetical protein